MPKLKSMAFLTPLLVILAMFLASPAMAQNAQTWMPASNDFDAAKHCYLDPQLADQVNLAGCEQKLKDEGKAYGYEFYFIVTVKGSEPNGSTTGQKFGAWKLDQYVGKIGKKLPSDKYVIVLIVYGDTSLTQRSLAAQGGNDLQKIGLTDSFFNAAGGPLARNNTIYLPNDPKGFMLAVAGEVNQATAKHIADKQAAEEEARRQAEEARRLEQQRAEEAARQAAAKAEHDRRMHTFWVFTGVGVPVLAVIILVVVLYMRRRNWKAKAEAAIAGVRTQLDSANAFRQKLLAAFGEFINDRKNWRDTLDPKGETFPDYETAIEAYSEFSIRSLTANRLVDQAEAIVKKASPWSIWTVADFAEAIALVTTKPVEITGEEIELKEVKEVTGGTLKKTTYKPADLLTSITALFNQANTGLQAIYDAFQKSDENKKDIEGLLKTVDETKTQLSDCGLVFDPYKERYEWLKQQQQSFLAIINSDPKKACKASDDVEEGVKALEQAMENAIAFKGKLDTETQPAIDRAVKRVAEVRGQTVKYLYPLVAGEAAPESLTGAKLLLNEEGNNPDTLLAQAREELAKSLEATLGANLTGAAQEKSKAEKSAADVLLLVEKIIKVKVQVEQKVSPVRAALEKLAGDIPGATKAVTELGAEFLAVNYQGEPDKLANANKVADSTDAELAKVKKAYDEQRYQAALTRVEKLGTDIQNATDKLVDIHQRLAKLRELKEHSRTTVAAAAQLSETLVDKLKANTFTTSAETDNAYARLAPSLETQQADVKKDITDWPASAAAADRLLASYQAVDRAIDSQKAQHDNAESALRALNTAVTSAAGFVKDAATRQPAIDKMSEARTSQDAVKERIAVAKSDWAAITRSAQEATAVAAAAEQLAKTDRRNFDDATASVQALGSAVSSAQTYVNDSATRQPAIDKMSDARTALSEVQGQIAKPKSDWASIAARAKEAVTVANSAAEMAKTDRRNYDDAVSSARSLATAINNAGAYVGDSATRQPAVNKLSEAQTALSDVQNQLRRPKSDWAAIAGKAKAAISIANAAGELAQADRKAYDRAVSSINSAAGTIRDTKTSYDHGVTADLGSANSNLRQARTSLSNGHYEDAEKYAGSVSGLAQEAVKVALAAVAAIIAEQERQARIKAEQAAAAERKRLQDLADAEAARLAALAAQQQNNQPRERERDNDDSPREDQGRGRSGDGVNGTGGRSGKGVGDF